MLEDLKPVQGERQDFLSAPWLLLPFPSPVVVVPDLVQGCGVEWAGPEC